MGSHFNAQRESNTMNKRTMMQCSAQEQLKAFAAEASKALSFNRLLAVYPPFRRGNVEDALREYERALRRDPDTPGIEDLVYAAQVMARSEQWQNESGKYIPRLKNWIHNCGWQEVLLPRRSSVPFKNTPQENLNRDLTSISRFLQMSQAAGAYHGLTSDDWQRAIERTGCDLLCLLCGMTVEQGERLRS